MPKSDKPLISIALLLKRSVPLDVARVQTAANAAFRDAPETPRVVPVGPPDPRRDMFGVILGPLFLGVIQSHAPYMADVGPAADRVSDFAGKTAIQSHTAWLSVDKVRDTPLPDAIVYGMIGRLLAEFLGDNTLGMILLPKQKVVGYDFSFLPMFRNGRALKAFTKPTPDRVVHVNPTDELQTATDEAITRWPEFLSAFENRKPGNGFAVKKMFTEGDRVEHMWVEVTAIDGDHITGALANDPQIVTELKHRDPVELDFDEVEDWIYSVGKHTIGGFQAKVIKAQRDAGNAD